jgi:methylglutaconyl-CoA hydratase
MKDSVSVLVESHNGLARVTLNRPQRRNALDASMIDTLREAFDELAQDPSVRAIVLGSSGSAFCAGADLNWMGSEGVVSGSGAQKDAARLMKMFRAIDECPCPVIGRIQGAAFGGGVGLIAVCDIAVAVDDATLALSEVRLGLVPAVIAPFLLRKAGESFLRRYCLTGESFSASAAQQFHLVHDVIEQDKLDARVDELVQMILRLAPQATRDTKALFRRLLTLSEDEQWTACIEANACARVSAEAQEGLRAFLEKRSPVWTEEQRGKEPPKGKPHNVAGQPA